MESITFKNVVPQVFAQRTDLESEVWATEATFNKNQLYLVEAESGKGKSTFCSYIQGYRHDYSGQILFDGNDIKQIKSNRWADLRRQHVSTLFQELRLFPELTAMENVEIKNNLTHWKKTDEILEWFAVLGISDKVNSKLGLMSFGQQQRVAMIRSLCQPFDFLLADEPISHLDDRNSALMGQIMLNEAHAQGAGVIVTSIGKHMQLNYDKVYKL